MKTAREWFQCLRPDLRKKAINNANRESKIDRIDWLKQEYSTFSIALGSSFIWSNSPERHIFWSKINDEAESIEEGRKPDIK